MAAEIFAKIGDIKDESLFTKHKTRSRCSRSHGIAKLRIIRLGKRGKPIIILNPADPPMIMRDTIFCAIPDAAADRDAIGASRSCHDRRRGRRRPTCPATGSLNEPQFDDPSINSGRPRRCVTTFCSKWRVPGDYLPPYAGNLDVMSRGSDQGRRGNRRSLWRRPTSGQAAHHCAKEHGQWLSTSTSPSSEALSFDCYGTLIDWEAGIAAVLAPWAARAGPRR